MPLGEEMSSSGKKVSGFFVWEVSIEDFVCLFVSFTIYAGITSVNSPINISLKMFFFCHGTFFLSWYFYLSLK